MVRKGMLPVAAFSIVALTVSPAWCADPEPMGLWYDHTGRGAVEIVKCNSNLLCGRLVWLKDPKHKEGCGLQIFGDAKPVATGRWDNGWIIDPEKDVNTKYSVELTLLTPTTLKVVGYLGTKFLGQTMMWQRAPSDLKRCPAA
jgi:uncharacterized protein (DUF2147 family)